MINSITVTEFQKIKDDPDSYLLDVRTPQEYAHANIGGELIPLAELQARAAEIPKDKNIYCLCHHGMRSMQATNFLMHIGHGKVFNIDGGIDQWSLQVDNKILRY